MAASACGRRAFTFHQCRFDGKRSPPAGDTEVRRVNEIRNVESERRKLSAVSASTRYITLGPPVVFLRTPPVHDACFFLRCDG